MNFVLFTIFFYSVYSRPIIDPKQSKQALQTVYTYLSDDELTSFDNATLGSFSTLTDLYNIDNYLNINNNTNNGTDWKELWEEYEAYAAEQCESLHLNSPFCTEDCIYYNNVLNWIPLILAPDNNTAAKAQLMRMVTFYSMSAGPLSYQQTGNPDMCLFSGGTYCYTPALTFPVMQQHACCLPGTCVAEDAVKVLNNNNWCYKQYANTYSASAVMNICEPMERELDRFGPLIVIIIFFIFVLLVIVASVIKRYCIEYGGDDIDLDIVSKNTFIASFNIESIWTTFGSVRSPDKTALNFLDGIRVWSMTWVILGHSYLFFFLSGATNLATFSGDRSDYHYLVQEFYTIFIQYAFYSVDSFFFLSGLLATFSIWRSLKKYGDRALSLWYLWIPIAYLMRILRIVPMMMYVTAIQWQISDQIPYGYHVLSRSTYTDYCDKDWYKILFFYANLTLKPDSSEALNCMGHLWYIQCDMQCFMILPFMLLLFKWNKLYGFISSLIPILICLILRFYYAFYYNFTANVIDPGYAPKNGGNQSNQSYFVTWPRMSVYFIGVALMFVILSIDEKHTKFVLNKVQYFIFLLLGSFILLCLVVWPYQDVQHQPDDRWSLLSNQFYYALGRPAWGLGLAFITFAFKYINQEKQQKSMIKEFLSLEIYQPLGKLTYLMYLLHLLAFSWWLSALEFPSYYNQWNELLLVIGVWSIVAFFSLILWFFMEKPIANLTTAFIKFIMMKCGETNVNDRKYKKSDPDEQLLFHNVNDDDNEEQEVSGYVPMGSINQPYTEYTE